MAQEQGIVDPWYGKTTVLIRGIERELKAFLKRKKEEWEKQEVNQGKDFFDKESYKFNPRNEEELRKIEGRNIDDWDITMGVKWLQCFASWGPLSMTQVDRSAIECLRNLRNKIDHRTRITAEDFEGYCEKCRIALKQLGVPDVKIDEIILAAQEWHLMNIRDLGSSDYVTEDILGMGNFAVVIKARNVIDRSVNAVKIIPNAEVEDKIFREAQNLQTLNHRNVISYKYAMRFTLPLDTLEKDILHLDSSFSDKKKDWNEMESVKSIKAGLYESGTIHSLAMVKGMYVVTEVCGENLRQWIHRNLDWTTRAPEERKSFLEDAGKICADITEGLKHIHRENIIHRDLRPENIFFSKSGYQFPIKIGDFGLSVQLSPSDLYYRTSKPRLMGHILYPAPEIQNADSPAKYGKEVDHFAFGFTISEVFDPVPDHEVEDKINHLKIGRTADRVKVISGELFDIVIKLTDKNPKLRMSLDDINERIWSQEEDEDISEKVSENASPPSSSSSTNDPQFVVVIPGSNLPGPSIKAQALPDAEPSPPPSETSPRPSEPSPPSAETSPPPAETTPHPAETSPPIAAPVPDIQRNSPPLSSDDDWVLIERDIPDLRKDLLRSGQMTQANVLEFLDKLDPDITHDPGATEKKTLSKYLHEIYRDRERRKNLTKRRLLEILVNMGFQDIAGHVAKRHFEQP